MNRTEAHQAVNNLEIYRLLVDGKPDLTMI